MGQAEQERELESRFSAFPEHLYILIHTKITNDSPYFLPSSHVLTVFILCCCCSL